MYYTHLSVWWLSEAVAHFDKDEECVHLKVFIRGNFEVADLRQSRGALIQFAHCYFEVETVKLIKTSQLKNRTHFRSFEIVLLKFPKLTHTS